MQKIPERRRVFPVQVRELLNINSAVKHGERNIISLEFLQ